MTTYKKSVKQDFKTILPRCLILNFKILGLVVMEKKIFKWLNFHIFSAHYICKKLISGHPEGLWLQNLQHRLILGPSIFCQNLGDLWPLRLIIICIPNCRKIMTARGTQIVACWSQQEQKFFANFLVDPWPHYICINAISGHQRGLDSQILL